MRIIKIQIKNFRAFYSHHMIKLAKTGPRGKTNLLVYGENGSGKTSLLLAIKYLLESGINNLNFDNYLNIFKNPYDDSYIKIFLREQKNQPEIIHEWSSNNCTTNHPDIIEASQAKGILDYKSLLELHFIHRQELEINIFNLLINSLLAKCENDNDSQQKTFAENWQNLLATIPKRKNYTKLIDKFNKECEIFNNGLRAKLNQLEEEITNLINYFGYDIEIKFEFQGVGYNPNIKYREDEKEKCINDHEILLKVKFLEKEITSPHHFLNEAKLSAIAISIYFSSLLVAPKPKIRLLILDDVFIGLDMSNRLPLIDIIKDKFVNNNYQVFLMTYDREWYEILKQRLDGNKWQYQELYCGKIEDNIEIPVWEQDNSYLEKAQEYLNPNPPQAPDIKASAVYLRTAFEQILKNFCDQYKLKVQYKENPKKLTTENFWHPICQYKKDGIKLLNPSQIEEIELYRTLIMNPLNHSTITQTYKEEIQRAIYAVKKLATTLDSI